MAAPDGKSELDETLNRRRQRLEAQQAAESAQSSKNELDETLNRRRHRSEAEGSVFETAAKQSGADTVCTATTSAPAPRSELDDTLSRSCRRLAGAGFNRSLDDTAKSTKSELEETLNRRRIRSEAAGSVFVGSAPEPPKAPDAGAGAPAEQQPEPADVAAEALPEPARLSPVGEELGRPSLAGSALGVEALPQAPLSPVGEELGRPSLAGSALGAEAATECADGDDAGAAAIASAGASPRPSVGAAASARPSVGAASARPSVGAASARPSVGAPPSEDEPRLSLPPWSSRQEAAAAVPTGPLPAGLDETMCLGHQESLRSQDATGTLDYYGSGAGPRASDADEAPPTAPASPAGSAQDLAAAAPGTAPGTASPSGGFPMMAAPGSMAQQPSAAGLAPGSRAAALSPSSLSAQPSLAHRAASFEDPLMSSTSYFQSYARSRPESERPGSDAMSMQSKYMLPVQTGRRGEEPPPSPQRFALPSQQLRHEPPGPFPRARDAVLQHKLDEVAPEVATLRTRVDEALARGQLHPAELQQILKTADGILERTHLADADLERLGWPTPALAQMRHAAGGLDAWQSGEAAAKRALAWGAEGAGPAPSAAQTRAALRDLLGAWCQLCALARAPLPLELGLDRRARGAAPMVSALLDQALALLRQRPDMVEASDLETLLKAGLARPELQERGLASLLKQSLQELSEFLQGLVQRGGYSDPSAAPGPALSSPDLLWRAIVDGDAGMVADVIRQGGLVSGRTKDPRGHSVFWDACAFHRTEVALLLLRQFPPDAPHGVDLGETHARNGNCLLHLVSGMQPFTPHAEGLFATLFERMPEVLQLHRNSRGQSFLHIAAGRLNFRVLRFAAMRGFSDPFVAEDNAGWSPLSLVEHHLSVHKVAEQPPPCRDMGGARLPSWCELGALQPPAAGSGSAPPLADVEVAVEDAERGLVHLHAHRVVLAASSTVWHAALRGQKPTADSGKTGTPMYSLRLEPQLCNNADVALLALRFLYTGVVGECTFKARAPLLMQLLRMCSRCRLPAALRDWALDVALRSLDEKENAVVPPSLLLEAATFGLAAEERQFVSRRLLRWFDAWRATGDERASATRTLEAALSEIEVVIARAEQSAKARAQMMGAPRGSAPLGSGYYMEDPLGKSTSGSMMMTQLVGPQRQI